MVLSEKSRADCREFQRYTPPPVAQSSERRKYFRSSPGGLWKKGATSRKPLFTSSIGAPGGSAYWIIAVVIVFIFLPDVIRASSQAGLMFWFTLKKLVGSYCFLMAAKRS